MTPPLLARLNHQDRVRLVGARGNPVRDLVLPGQGMLLGIATAPSGKGYLAVTRTLTRRQPILAVTSVSTRGIPNSPVELSANPDLSVRMASIPGRQLACVCYHEATTEEARIAYLRAEDEDDGGKLRVSAIVPTQGSCEMLQDEAGTTCVAVRRTRGGVVLTRLDDAPTEFPDCGVACTNLPRVTWPLWCPLTPDPALGKKLRQQFTFEYHAQPGPEATARWISDRMASLASSTTSSLGFYRFLRAEKHDAEADELLSGLQGRFPDNPYVQLAMIERDASLGRWTGGELLERTREAIVREHLLHLHAMICLHDNRFEDAVWILSEAPKGAGCQLADILDLAHALLAGRSAHAPSEGAAPGGLRELVRTILWADHHVEEGDTEGARRLLDQAWIREVGEVQSLARLALITLAAPPDPAMLFRTLALMADFVDANLVDGYASNLWLGKSTWDSVHLNEVPNPVRGYFFCPGRGWT